MTTPVPQHTAVNMLENMNVHRQLPSGSLAAERRGKSLSGDAVVAEARWLAEQRRERDPVVEVTVSGVDHVGASSSSSPSSTNASRR